MISSYRTITRHQTKFYNYLLRSHCIQSISNTQLNHRFQRTYSTKETQPLHPDENIASQIYKHAHEPQTSTSLQTLMKTGRGEYLHKTFHDHKIDSGIYDDNKVATERVLIQVAGFLRHELPIRLAHRIKDLSRVPCMKDMPSVQNVKNLYITSFLELIEFNKSITNYKEELAFSEVVEKIYDRHAGVLVDMAKGAYELRASLQGKDFNSMQETHDFLDRFYVSRIGIRVLIGQYLALRQPPVPHYIGIVCTQTSPFEIVKRAIDDASFMCTRKYGESPDVIITGRLDLTFPYVPTHLHYIMLELLKNSMRATVDWYGLDVDSYPPIKVIIADGKENEDVVIKVSDEGGGIPRSNVPKIWSYLFTTADPTIQEGIIHLDQNTDHSIDAPLAGLGYGLPISRSYARYFGGDLSIMSMEGFGTDAFVYLTRLGNSREPLPH